MRRAKMQWMVFLPLATDSLTTVLAVIAGTGGVMMGLSPLTQLVRILRRRHSDDVSASWPAVISGGTALWAVYGVAIEDWAIIIANIVGVICAAATLFVVLRFRSWRRGVADPEVH